MGGAASRPIQKGSEMRWTRPHHGRWLAACLVAFLLSGSFGGFNASIAMVFLVIFVVGAVLLSPGDAEGDLGDDAEIEDSGEGDTETEAVVDQQDLEADEPAADADGHGEPATGIADEPDEPGDPDDPDDPDDTAADASESGTDAPSDNQSRPAGTPDPT